MARKQSGRASGDDEGHAPERDDMDLEPSRSARKRESHELTSLGEQLGELPAERWRALELPERLMDALAEAQRLTSFGARRRQTQFIGKLVRSLDEDLLARIRAAVREK